MKCNICGAVLKDCGSLGRHNRRFHKSPSNPKMVCGMCDGRFHTNLELESHVSKVHDVSVEHEKLSFHNVEDFGRWRRTVESDHLVKFIRFSSKKSSGKTLVYYTCNRSGQARLVPEDSRKRHSRLSGTRKSGSQCLSRITASLFLNGSVDVDFCKTHCGHSVQVKHLPISSPKKRKISAKVASKIPLEEVVNQVRPSVVNLNNELKRKHLITRRNTKKLFSLETERLHSVDATSVTAWVDKERALDSDSCVILFKPKGIMPEEYLHFQHKDEVEGGLKNGLKKCDFLLGIMTKGQEEVLKAYGENGVISMDSTHGTNGYELTTVMVLDDMKQGFPVAFFISDRQDLMGVTIFLDSIKEKVGSVRATTFMSGMARVFYNGWSQVMGHCEFRLIYTWHVIRAWQENMKDLIKVDTKREDTFAKLYAVLTEADAEAFEEMLPSILEGLCEDEDTLKFGGYFKKEYSKRPKFWAYCHRKNAGVNANMNLERYHKLLNHTFLDGQMTKRLDETIHALVRLVDWKIYDRLLTLENGTLTYKVRELRRRHVTSKSLSFERIVPTAEPSVWNVFRANRVGAPYKVTLSDPNCTCAILCAECKACFHKFKCTCIDYEIKSVMCKHIHLLCRFSSGSVLMDRAETTTTDEPSVLKNESPELCIVENSTSNERFETRSLLNRLRRDEDDTSQLDLESRKRKIEEMFSSILKDVKTINGAAAFTHVLKGAIPIVRAAEDLSSHLRVFSSNQAST